MEAVAKKETKREPTLREKYVKLQKIHDSTNEAVVRLEEIVLKQGRQIQQMNAQLDNADLNVQQQKKIVENNIAQAREKEAEFVERIEELLGERRALRAQVKALSEENAKLKG